MSTPASASHADHVPTAPETDRHRSSRAVVLRWMASFLGFPLGGLAAMLLVGPVDSLAAALLGGLVTGAVLGIAQGFGQRLGSRDVIIWAVATAAGLSVGLAAGAGVVGHGTELVDLVVQGVACGVAVGVAQGIVLRRGGAGGSLGRPIYAWPAYLGVVWALGWAVTILVGVQVTDQFTVFGSAGAVTVTALTTVLPLRRARRTS